MLPKNNRKPVQRWMRWALAVAIWCASAATAQVPTRERLTGALRPVTPSGVVVAITPEAVTINNRAGECGFRLDRAAIIHLLKPIRLADITEPRWATIYRESNRGQIDEITVAWVKVEAKTTGQVRRETESGDQPLPPMAMRPSLSGRLMVEGASATLECDGQTLNLKFSERTRVYEARPATLSEVKVGANVMLDLRVANLEFVAKGIDIMPPLGEDLVSPPATKAESVRRATVIATDEDGRPIDGVTVHVCGEERRLPDGSWDRNHTPHCLMPRVSMGVDGRFTVPFEKNDVRLNLWIEKEGFAPTYVAGLSPQPPEAKMIMKRGIQVSGHVNRFVNGKLEPVKGAVVYLGCASGDAAHLKAVLEDPYFFVMKMNEGEDLPYLQTVFTGGFGEYAVRLSPPPKDKMWFLVCLDEVVTLDVKEDQPTKGPDFVVEVLVRGPGENGGQTPVAGRDR